MIYHYNQPTNLVGNNSQWGKLRATLVTESVDTPLQEKLDMLAGHTYFISSSSSSSYYTYLLLLLLLLFICIACLHALFHYI